MNKIQRELGEALPISIGTAIALEGSVLIEKSPIKELWINVHTLFRNFFGSIPDIDKHKRADVISEFLLEIEYLYQFLAGEKIDTLLYTTAQNNTLAKIFPKAKVRVPTTPNQLLYADYEAMALKYLNGSRYGPYIKKFTVRLSGAKTEWVYLLTHQPLDLLSDYEFRNMALLESHTGEIKSRARWTSKLTSDEHAKQLPFNILTIQVLGDKGKQFHAMGGKYKKDLLRIAAKNRWTPITHHNIVHRDIKNDNGEFSELFTNILRSPYR